MQPAATRYLQKMGPKFVRINCGETSSYEKVLAQVRRSMSTMPSTSLLRQLSSTMVSDEGLVVMEIPVAADDDMGLTAPALLTAA